MHVGVCDLQHSLFYFSLSLETFCPSTISRVLISLSRKLRVSCLVSFGPGGEGVGVKT